VAIDAEQQYDGSAILLHQVHHLANFYYKWAFAVRCSTPSDVMVQKKGTREKVPGLVTFVTFCQLAPVCV